MVSCMYVQIHSQLMNIDLRVLHNKDVLCVCLALSVGNGELHRDSLTTHVFILNG